MSRLAVVLFNLGGPDSLESVEPFLRNLFWDPAIIRALAPVRWLLGWLVSKRRGPEAREIYRELGGASPIAAATEAQAVALRGALSDLGEVEVVVAMRYWHPRSGEAARRLAAFRPDSVVLLPLYPQFSTTTTASSLRAWDAAATAAGLDAPAWAVCCYPRAAGLVDAHAALIGPLLDEAARAGPPRLLFSAHGLPEKVVVAGDPYQWQVGETAGRIIARLGRPALDWVICYQSRVGPLAWLGPSTEDEIDRAGRDGVPLVVAPIAFVSDHAETLVELDVTGRERARRAGVPCYSRVPALGTHPAFIAALADLVRGAMGRSGLGSGEGGRACPATHRRCALAARQRSEAKDSNPRSFS